MRSKKGQEAKTKRAVSKGPKKNTGKSQHKGSKVLSPEELFAGELAGDVTVTVGGNTLKLTNLHKIYWPGDGLTKGDLLRYYFQISSYVLPYLKNRPLILKRYPDGIERPAFHQHSLTNPPPFVRTFSRASQTGQVIHPVCNSLATLLYLANLGSISLHAWASRTNAPEKPDWIVFDLDPGEADFGDVCEGALVLKQILGELDLAGYPKTSGSSGLHVYLPIKPMHDYEIIAGVAALIAQQATRIRPDILTVERSIKARKGRIYVDHMQNGFGKSVAVAYSVRARGAAPVSAPLTWKEVQTKRFGPRDYTIKNLSQRLKKTSGEDLFLDVLKNRQSLSRALSRLKSLNATNS
jgi:bifunctional non-homologous end joining protein LigD